MMLMEDLLRHLIIIIIVLTTIDLIEVDTTIMIVEVLLIIIEVAIAAEATILLRFIIIIIIEEEIAVEDRVGMAGAARKRYRACRNSLPWKTNGLGSKIGAAHANNVKGRPVSLIFCPIHPLRLLLLVLVFSEEQPPWPIHPSWPPPMRQPPR